MAGGFILKKKKTREKENSAVTTQQGRAGVQTKEGPETLRKTQGPPTVLREKGQKLETPGNLRGGEQGTGGKKIKEKQPQAGRAAAERQDKDQGTVPENIKLKKRVTKNTPN